MNYEKLIEELYQALEDGEQKYSYLSFKAMEKHNITSMAAMSAQATGWTQARYVLDELLIKYRDK